MCISTILENNASVLRIFDWDADQHVMTVYATRRDFYDTLRAAFRRMKWAFGEDVDPNPGAAHPLPPTVFVYSRPSRSGHFILVDEEFLKEPTVEGGLGVGLPGEFVEESLKGFCERNAPKNKEGEYVVSLVLFERDDPLAYRLIHHDNRDPNYFQKRARIGD